jgi:Cu/Ag efflux pump CusA
MEKIGVGSKYRRFINWWPDVYRLGSEFMPPLDEGSIIYASNLA